jgi:hypothetical protein
LFGVGCGMIAIGAVNFDLVEYNDSMNKTVIKEHEMVDSLIIYPSYDNEIEYIEEDIPNVKIEYKVNKYCDVEDQYNENTTSIHSWVSCQKPMKLVRETLKTINDDKIIYFNNIDESIVIHASSDNINRLKENWNHVLEENAREEEEKNRYESIIEEMEEKNNELSMTIDELNEELEFYRNNEVKEDE